MTKHWLLRLYLIRQFVVGLGKFEIGVLHKVRHQTCAMWELADVSCPLKALRRFGASIVSSHRHQWAPHHSGRVLSLGTCYLGRVSLSRLIVKMGTSPFGASVFSSDCQHCALCYFRRALSRPIVNDGHSPGVYKVSNPLRVPNSSNNSLDTYCNSKAINCTSSNIDL